MSVPNFEVIGQFRPIYNYFRFLKTNGRHIEFLFPVLILTISSLSACHYAAVYEILSKSDYTRLRYDVVAIFKMVAVRHVGFGVGKW